MDSERFAQWADRAKTWSQDFAELCWERKYFLAWVGSWITWLFSLLVVTQCTFMQSTTPVGLFSRSFMDEHDEFLGCVHWSPDQDNFGRAFATGRAFGIMTVVYTSVAVLLSSIALVFDPPKTRIIWLACRVSLLAATFCQGMTYVALRSDLCQHAEECTLAAAGLLGVVNVFLLAMVAFGFIMLPIPTTTQWLQWYKAIERDPDEQPREPGIQRTVSFRIMITTLIAIAWSLNLIGVRRCTFILVGLGGHLSTAGLGLYSQAVDNQGVFLGCVAFPQATVALFDPPFKTGRVFGALSVVVMTSAFTLGVFQLFQREYLHRTWAALRVLLPIAAAAQLISFTALGTEICENAECQLGSTGLVVVMDILLIVTMAALIGSIEPPTEPVLVFNRKLTAGSRTEVSFLPNRTAFHEGPVDGLEEEDTDYLESFESKFEKPSLKPMSRSRFSTRLSMNEKYGFIEEEEEEDESEEEEAADAISDNFEEYGQVESISVQVEYTTTEKKTIKTVTHIDGSQTIVTTIEDLTEVEEECSIDEDSELD